MIRLNLNRLLNVIILMTIILSLVIIFGFFQKTSTALDDSSSDFDLDGNGFIEKSEVIYALNQYNFGKITKAQLIDVLKEYFGV